FPSTAPATTPTSTLSLHDALPICPRDAVTIETFSRELEAIADVLRQFVLRAPPNIVEGFGIGAIREAFNAIGTASILRKLSLEQDRKSTRLNSSHRTISYAVFCLK